AGPNSLYAAGPALGVVASGDGGLTWEQRSRNEGATFLGRILVDPADANHLTAADARTGPSVSVDGGRSWRSLQLAPVVWVSSPDGGPTVYASSGMGGAWRSSDAGKYWEALELPRGATLVEAAAIGDGRKLYAAGVDGEVARLWVSVDGGATWNEPAAKPSNS
ncbi:MAG: hypothetical protein Q8K63_04770, partial [Acidimicrobiales bacterium]|nr:hypothetical protein [Acidimicrobiales bacterium]